jgi:hypothetical protein
MVMVVMVMMATWLGAGVCLSLTLVEPTCKRVRLVGAVDGQNNLQQQQQTTHTKTQIYRALISLLIRSCSFRKFEMSK